MSKLSKEEKERLAKLTKAAFELPMPNLEETDPFEIFEGLGFFGIPKNKTKPLNRAEKAIGKIYGKDYIDRRAKEMGVKPKVWLKRRAGLHISDFEPGSGRRRTGFTDKTMATIQKAKDIIDQYNVRLTIRQIYYRFVGEQLIENSLKSYKNLAGVLANAREAGYIPYNKIVDTSRAVIKSNSWTSPKDFFETVRKAYKKNLLEDQDSYIEVWVEKDALRSVFEPITDSFDVNLVIGKGYPSHSALYEASNRIGRNSDKTTKILYFGDFDPSGEDIFRDVQVRMERLFGKYAEFTKVALTLEDIEEYKLPPAPAKRTDVRFERFVQAHGDISVELDALPPDALVEKIKDSILRNIDVDKYQIRLDQEETERAEIERLVKTL